MNGELGREDEHGHALDQDNKLVYDPRCYYCRNSTDQLSYVKVEINPGGGS